MKLTKIKRTPGFRLNGIDLIFIGLMCCLSYALHYLLPESSIFGIPLYLVFSFFLFCNVFRIGNRMEPFWYIPFFILTAYSLNSFDMIFFWNCVIYIFEPLKWSLIIYRIWKGPYLGIGSREPDLNQ